MESFDPFGGLEELGFKERPSTFLDLFKKDNKGKKNAAAGGAGNKEMLPEDYLFYKKYTCPSCAADFENTDVRTSKTKFLSTDTDLRPYYEPIDPLYYDVIVCTKCGYAAMSNTFKTLSDKQSDLISEAISSNYKSKKYPLVYSIDDAIERYKLALLNTVVKKGKSSEKAMLCLKLGWLMREKKNNEHENFFLKSAYTGFSETYEHENLPVFGMDDMTLCYLLGELARRTGNTEVAMRFIGTVVVNKKTNPRLKNRALEVRDLIREAKAVKATEKPPVAPTAKKV